ncbi:hypothetical protein WJX74_006316 [Apatococcus lobatus]|uniref:Uncharacterized protein n=1 Tax=Apatococcus lobatus TaxID=904363 RepID=A0AAW1RJB0_9CHLO
MSLGLGSVTRRTLRAPPEKFAALRKQCGRPQSRAPGKLRSPAKTQKLHPRTLSRRRGARNGAHTSWARLDVQEVDLLQLDGLFKPQQDPVRTGPPLCTFLDPEVISRALDGLNYMTERAEAGRAAERRYMPITYIEGEAGLGKSTMAVNLHQGMQDVCRTPEGQLKWPHAAKLLNDPGATSECLLKFSGSQDDSDQLAKAPSLAPFLGSTMMAAQFNLPDHELQRISKTLVYQLGYFATEDQTDSNAHPCEAARHGMVLLSGIFGTALGAIRRHSLLPQMPCELQTLRALPMREGTELLRSRLRGEFGLPPEEFSPQLDVFMASDAYRAVMENLAGVLGAIVTLTQVLTANSSIICDLQKYCKSDSDARPDNMIFIGRQLLDRAMDVFGHRAFVGGTKKALGGAKARLTIFLLAATGMTVERDLRIGESERQTLEEAACTGVFTLEPTPNEQGRTRVRMMPLRMEALSASLDELDDLIPSGLLFDDLVPHLQVPIKPAPLETMLAARLAAQAVLASRLCELHELRVGDLLGAAKCTNPALLRLSVKIQPLRVVRATGALLKKLPEQGRQEGARVEWVARSTVKVAPYTANPALDAGRVEEVSALDPTRITLLNAPGVATIAFDAQVLFDGSQAGEPSINLFASVKRRAPKNSDIIDELLSENHELARQSIRDQGLIQNFFPIFVYVSTASTDKLDEALERLANQGEKDILVLSEDELGTFLPVVASRASLVPNSWGR